MDPVERARAHADRCAGLLSGLHIVGSAALGDVRPGSDLDVVGELAAAPSLADVAVLAAAHAADPLVEAVYVLPGDLAAPVDAASDGPWGAEGVLHAESRSFQLNPVTWQQLAEHAITVVGGPPSPPVSGVAEFCAANLESYWAPLLDDTTVRLAARPDDQPVDASGPEWLALGPPRLWHTIRTGEIVSKTRAGELAAARWPEFAPLLADVLAARRGEPRSFTTVDARAVVELGRAVLADARADR